MKTGLCKCGCGKKTRVPRWNSTRDGDVKGVPKDFIQGHNSRIEELHPRWKGDNASYSAIHMWVRKHLKKLGVCSRCGARPGIGKDLRKRRTQFANISGTYMRDVDDYIELCVPCHRRFDNPR